MFKRFCSQAFGTINVAVGFFSLAAIVVGAITVFGSAGLLCLDKAGVKTIPEKRIQQTLQLGMGFTLLGSVGFVSATVAAACIASISGALDEEESVTSSYTNSVVFELSESTPTQDNTDSLYLYQIMRITGCRHLDNKLIVGRVEDESSRKVVVYDLLDSDSQDSLMELFDLGYDEDKLISKAFSSQNPNPNHAIREFVDFYRPQLEFKSSCEEFSSFNLETCVGCRNFHGADKIVCGIHPYGWEQDDNCPDWQSNQRRQKVYFPFEREEVISQLNCSIQPNQVSLLKNDDGTLTLWDDYTNRRFQFLWSGVLLDDFDKLLELDEYARLLDYIQYFSVRTVIEFDYSLKVDEFAQQLQGIATVKISDSGINVRVNYCPKLNIHIERQYRFRFDGIPLYPYESIVPQSLKYNYNLGTLVEWLKVNQARVRL
ncbi:hypothetical protein [Calothrix sp. PCC 6303]|uniref:hypothetical protein n=1 Tax=Calothrix sp. PCC 6303 TaxID=1170562 RepID=UPI0002A01E3F|nr:hypothetical protein [Calothrix sp. PCC 6303]AFZ01531.1 hypothetical protein Cal6303_2549 [Calothrix sp. PCC 6303]